MRKNHLFILSFVSSLFFAQQTISFESSEGYELGNINGQNGWTVTETSDGLLTNQVVSDEFAKTGNYAFKNAFVPELDFQWLPIIGVEKSFSPALDDQDLTISYDFYATEQNGSDFEFALYSINQEDDAYDTLLAVGFENRGMIYLYPELNFGGFTYADATWEPNQWYNLKIHITKDKITYYLDDVQIFENENTAKLKIDGMNFLHNNFGGDAYYDNIKINDEELAVNTIPKGKINMYPNPVADILNIQLSSGEKLENIEIYSVSGQKILTENTEKEINVKKLQPGNYIVKAKNTTGKTYTSKIVKK